MAGITGLGTTFNLPNYAGELIAITPADTPLLSAAGGVGGGKQTDSPGFEWQESDLREPDSRPRLEGADAPDPEARVRANVTNVVQIFHEAVATTYTKQAAVGQYATPGTAPYHSNSGEPNPVTNEHAWQVTQAIVQMARDVNYTFWHGRKHVPTSNAEPRRTGGLLEAATSTRVGTFVDGTTATDTITSATHGLDNGDRVVFTTIAATGLRYDRVYHVRDSATNTFKVAAAPGGTAITLGTGTVTFVEAVTPVTVDAINELLRSVFDHGGITETGFATLFVPSTQKVRITKAYATEYGKADPVAGVGRTIGGVSVEAIVTPFGTLNVAIERALAPDTVAVVSVEQLDPVFLSIPGKGVLFEEPLAKTGASDKTQIYGEIGLKWGNERAHGYIRGLAV